MCLLQEICGAATTTSSSGTFGTSTSSSHPDWKERLRTTARNLANSCIFRGEDLEPLLPGAPDLARTEGQGLTTSCGKDPEEIDAQPKFTTDPKERKRTYCSLLRGRGAGSRRIHLLPILVSITILLIHLPLGQAAPMDPLKNLEYQENRAEASRILAKRFVPLIMGFAWIAALEILTTVDSTPELQEDEKLPQPLLDRVTRATPEADPSETRVKRFAPLLDLFLGSMLKKFAPTQVGFKNGRNQTYGDIVPFSNLKFSTTAEPRRIQRDAPSILPRGASTNSSTNSNQTTPEQQAIQVQNFLKDLSYLNLIMSFEGLLPPQKFNTHDRIATSTLETPKPSGWIQALPFIYIFLVILIAIGAIHLFATLMTPDTYLHQLLVEQGLHYLKGSLTKGKDMKQKLALTYDV
jgi:hypothetical protein